MWLRNELISNLLIRISFVSLFSFSRILVHTIVVLFQVITGGQYDVDVKIEGPNKQIIYQQQKMQYDSHQFTAQITGINEVFHLMLLFLDMYFPHDFYTNYYLKLKTNDWFFFTFHILCYCICNRISCQVLHMQCIMYCTNMNMYDTYITHKCI